MAMGATKPETQTGETMMTATFIAIRVDDENNAESFWDALRSAYPELAASLSRNSAAVIESSLWDKLAEMPGFEDGPAHAPCALIDCGGEGDQWSDVVGARHAVFTRLK
jgi:hypothetical protein